MARWTLGFLIAALIITHFSALPSLQLVGCLVVISSLLLVFFRRHFAFLFPWLIAFLVGLVWVLLVANNRVKHYLPSALEGKTLLATGMIVSIPEYHSHQLRFDFLIKKIATNLPINYPLRVRLSGYRYSRFYHPPQLSKGEVWEFTIRLKRPRAFWNPGSFDYQAALFEQNIQATGYILDKSNPRLIQAASFYYIIDHLREKVTTNIKKALNNYPLLGLISALTTGVRYEITEAQWNVMRGTGTNHLFAISGLHLAFITGFIYWITRFIYARIPYATLVIPAPKIAAGLTCVLAVFYSILAGFALPIQRALIMLLVFLIANLFGRNLPPGAALNYALLIILVCSPFAVLSASFWLSFMAVAFIFYAALGRIKPTKNWRAWLNTQYSIGLGLIPVSLLFFQKISWLSFIANAIAIPSVGFIILPIALIGGVTTLFISSWGNSLLILAERLLELLWQLLTYFSTLDWAQYTTFIINPWILISSLFAVLLLLAPKGFPGRNLSILYLLPLVFWRPEPPKYGEVWFNLLDVGQGLATVVQTQHHILVYDTGPNRSFDAGRTVLVPFLQYSGINKLDMLMVSHGDNDHIGGAKTLLEKIPVAHIISSVPEKFLPQQAKFCAANTRWEWDQVSFEILYPPANTTYLGNNSSCVLKISTPKNSILLTGDIEKEAENYLVHHLSDHLHSTILIVPHHGSKTSSGIEFLNTVNPRIALFATGYRNQFKFPHTIVLQRYQSLGAKIYDTALDGMITLKLNPNSYVIETETYQQKQQYFWKN